MHLQKKRRRKESSAHEALVVVRAKNGKHLDGKLGKTVSLHQDTSNGEMSNNISPVEPLKTVIAASLSCKSCELPCKRQKTFEIKKSSKRKSRSCKWDWEKVPWPWLKREEEITVTICFPSYVDNNKRTPISVSTRAMESESRTSEPVTPPRVRLKRPPPPSLPGRPIGIKPDRTPYRHRLAPSLPGRPYGIKPETTRHRPPPPSNGSRPTGIKYNPASPIKSSNTRSVDPITFNVKTQSVRVTKFYLPICFVKQPIPNPPSNTRSLMVKNAEFIPGEVEIRIQAFRKPMFKSSVTDVIPTLRFSGYKGPEPKEIAQIRARIPPRTMAHVLTLIEDEPRTPTSHRFNTEEWMDVSFLDTWRWGPTHEQSADPSAWVDGTPCHGYKWLFPISASYPVACAQGFDGPNSHSGDLRFSIDFGVPVGTPILCPRDGIVVDLKDDSDVVGETPEFESHANYLSIVHEDGTCSELIHLKYKGIKVFLGDFVRRGQVLGESGNTGFSFGPHLHFHVRDQADESGKTLPICFDNGTSEGFILTPGQAYNPETNEISEVTPPIVKAIQENSLKFDDSSGRPRCIEVTSICGAPLSPNQIATRKVKPVEGTGITHQSNGKTLGSKKESPLYKAPLSSEKVTPRKVKVIKEKALKYQGRLTTVSSLEVSTICKARESSFKVSPDDKSPVSSTKFAPVLMNSFPWKPPPPPPQSVLKPPLPPRPPPTRPPHPSRLHPCAPCKCNRLQTRWCFR